MIFLTETTIERLRAQAEKKERAGDSVAQIATAFPKNPPPPGITYAKNFARFQKGGRFAVQVRD